jgi:uncharacterized phage infection (PIP) family protein YhgE
MSSNKTEGKKDKNKNRKPGKIFDPLNKILDGNRLESDFAEGMKKGVNDFIESANSFSSAMHNHDGDLTKKIIQNLTDNFNNSFENNLVLSQECLKCRTATDFIDIQRKFFEHNYQVNVRTYTDLVHDMQQIVNHNMKHTKSCCFGK